MVTTNIGRIFLDAYNEKYKTEYTPKTFFDEVFFPLFFDSSKYLQWIQNSPLTQGLRKGKPFTKDELQTIRQKIHEKIESGAKDASIAPGYPAADLNATTSGQVSNVKIKVSFDDIYLSWFGSSLGLGVKGGISILLFDKRFLLDIFEGWKLYRHMLETFKELAANKVNTWNAQWLAHRYDYDYNPDNPMENFEPWSDVKDGVASIKMQTWTKVLIGISRNFVEPKTMAYVCNLGDTNTTVGFIPFVLEQIRKPAQLYKKLFGGNFKQVEDLWTTKEALGTACRQGVIGIKALEPKGLSEYYGGDIPKYKEEQIIKFQTYQIWLLAMLNNEQLWDLSRDFAMLMEDYAKSSVRGKVDNRRKAESVISSKNKKDFVENITSIISEVSDVDKFMEFVGTVNKMPTDNVPYLLTLVRLHYAAINNVKSK